MTTPAEIENPTIGVMGCLPVLPQEFPIEMPENAGNTIHAMAPFEMFPSEAIFYKNEAFSNSRLGDFTTYVNENCSHLIVTLANFVKLGDESGSKYLRFHNFLKKINVPIVVFGLGAQSKTQDFEGELPVEAIDLMKFLGDASSAVGVRGAFTAGVFEHYAGVKNTYVTGCPSFFSRPDAFGDLRRRLDAAVNPGGISYNGTTYHEPDEKKILIKAINQGHHLIEPVNRFTARFSEELKAGALEPELPWFLKGPIKNGLLSRDQVQDYFRDKFHLFRQPEPWYEFNQKHIAFTYGTRFHVNMASLLSGVPALWITHDSRTEELTDFLKVPRVPKLDAVHMSTDDLIDQVDYSEMFESLHELFANFNGYLRIHGLPEVDHPRGFTPSGVSVD